MQFQGYGYAVYVRRVMGLLGEWPVFRRVTFQATMMATTIGGRANIRKRGMKQAMAALAGESW